MTRGVTGSVVVLAAVLAAAPVVAQEQRVAGLERKVEVLTGEIEKVRLGAVEPENKQPREQPVEPVVVWKAKSRARQQTAPPRR